MQRKQPRPSPFRCCKVSKNCCHAMAKSCINRSFLGVFPVVQVVWKRLINSFSQTGNFVKERNLALVYLSFQFFWLLGIVHDQSCSSHRDSDGLFCSHSLSFPRLKLLSSICSGWIDTSVEGTAACTDFLRHHKDIQISDGL